jgi:hypothetical protein
MRYNMPDNIRHTFERQAIAWNTLSQNAASFWCELMHDSPMWPIHGRYQCRTCGRHYSVPWLAEQAPEEQVTPAPQIRRAHVPYFRSALLPSVILLAVLLATVVQAAEPPTADATARASLAFARYITGVEGAASWDVESVEIEASLPKLEKQGRLTAIRRLAPFAKPEYQVIESSGDPTVKRQVIGRYLSAQVQAARIPASAVAITTANYKFHYRGAEVRDAGPVYAFSIAPRKKREGLIRGELWIDESGGVVRESGYFVKSPSIFIKRIEVTLETSPRNESAEERITHLSVDTRLVGRAELTIHEHPYVVPTPALEELK